ncbi:MAG: hypothetical protein ACI3ZQ_04935 [Candidatus Cryptobacteroides sp.]
MKKLTNIPPVSDFESQGKRTYYKLYVIEEADIDYTKLDEDLVDETARTMKALPLKADAAGWKEFNFAKFTLGGTSEGSAGDITSTVTNSQTGTLGGERNEIDDLLENKIGVPFLTVEIDRFTQKKKIYGRPYSPMYLNSFSKRKNGDNTSADITFQNESFFQPLEYLGDLTTPAVAG